MSPKNELVRGPAPRFVPTKFDRDRIRAAPVRAVTVLWPRPPARPPDDNNTPRAQFGLRGVNRSCIQQHPQNVPVCYLCHRRPVLKISCRGVWYSFGVIVYNRCQCSLWVRLFVSAKRHETSELAPCDNPITLDIFPWEGPQSENLTMETNFTFSFLLQIALLS